MIAAARLPTVSFRPIVLQALFIPLHDEIATAAITRCQFWHVLMDMKRNLVVMVHHGFFANPVQRWHVG